MNDAEDRIIAIYYTIWLYFQTGIKDELPKRYSIIYNNNIVSIWHFNRYSYNVNILIHFTYQLYDYVFKKSHMFTE